MRLMTMKVGGIRRHLQVRPNEIDRCAGLSFRPVRTKDERLLPTQGVPAPPIGCSVMRDEGQQFRLSTETKIGLCTKFSLSGHS
jgi:hypothetical protein